VRKAKGHGQGSEEGHSQGYEMMRKPNVVAYICNLSTWEAEAGGLHILGQPGLDSVIVFHKRK
jgi:hypothetical protein